MFPNTRSTDFRRFRISQNHSNKEIQTKTETKMLREANSITTLWKVYNGNNTDIII